jgi:2-(1,2-epoxy-1,2-dihydrophenyl)acetyl-CoA isomerase
LSREDIVALLDGLAEAAEAPETRVLLLRGEGRAFCSGADLSLLEDIQRLEGSERELALRPAVALTLRLVRFPHPTVSAIQGPCYGGGACLALACDHIVAADDTRLGFIFNQLGLPGGDMAATWLLKRRLGTRKAWRVLVNAEVIEAADALERGLVDEVVKRGAEAGRARAVATEFSQGATSALAATKLEVLMLEGAFEQLTTQTELELREIAGAIGGAEFRESFAALRARTSDARARASEPA